MNWFRRKQKSRPYPAVYSEWSVEFRRISDTKRPMTEADATQLSDGVLQDGK